ncbi:MAG: hypothetical protein B6I36_07655 [Desulfobacteraceae bacterium 4572_35.1]|nr:MAG: hypothetical protein B6I36_07655 [Desulfobacteraceae bacterium 4572_35.1]
MKSPEVKKAMVLIEQAFKRSGYENAYNFHKRSGVGVAYYTIVRMLDPAYPKPPSIQTVIEVAYYAGCKPEEIKQILISMGDKFWHKLLADPTHAMSCRELALVDTARTITAKDDAYWKNIADNLRLIAQASGTHSECEDELGKLGA